MVSPQTAEQSMAGFDGRTQAAVMGVNASDCRLLWAPIEEREAGWGILIKAEGRHFNELTGMVDQAAGHAIMVGATVCLGAHI